MSECMKGCIRIRIDFLQYAFSGDMMDYLEMKTWSYNEQERFMDFWDDLFKCSCTQITFIQLYYTFSFDVVLNICVLKRIKGQHCLVVMCSGTTQQGSSWFGSSLGVCMCGVCMFSSSLCVFYNVAKKYGNEVGDSNTEFICKNR